MVSAALNLIHLPFHYIYDMCADFLVLELQWLAVRVRRPAAPPSSAFYTRDFTDGA